MYHIIYLIRKITFKVQYRTGFESVSRIDRKRKVCKGESMRLQLATVSKYTCNYVLEIWYMVRCIHGNYSENIILETT